ncbi:hypothetical protein [Streptomyces anulatus]|uniref:hypothetical protein n=1 Tax=Streptomyces anulatus TaxID=1892 RepID=UPI00369F8B45
MNQIRNLPVSPPALVREQVASLERTALIRTLARLRPGDDVSRPPAVIRASLRRQNFVNRFRETRERARLSDPGHPVTAAPTPEQASGPPPYTLRRGAAGRCTFHGEQRRIRRNVTGSNRTDGLVRTALC